MNIMICDANEFDAKIVANILDNSYGSKMKTEVFHRADDAISYIRSGANVDVCFLETVTPEMDGIKLARTLREDGYKGEIAFISKSKNYGPESYEVGAIAYLSKPVMPEEIREIVGKVKDKQKRIAVSSPVIYNKAESVPHREVSCLDRVKLFFHGLFT